MFIDWKNINGERHVFTSGDTICGVSGLERNEPAPPCQTCLARLMELVSTAFLDDFQ